jgi:hypothetical protein
MSAPIALAPLPLAHFLFQGAPLLVLITAVFAAVTGVFGINFMKPAGWRALCIWLLMLVGIGVGIWGWRQSAVNLRDADLAARTAARDHADDQKSIRALQDKVDKLIAPPPNDVSLCLVEHARPALVLVNTTDRVASDILYSFGLFDLDSDMPNIPLRIPTGPVNFIKPGLWAGPMDFLSSIYAGGPSVKDGDRIVGSIAVTCPTCTPAHTILLSVVLGKGGWYAPYQALKGTRYEGLVAPISLDPKKPFFDARMFLAILATVPQSERLAIEDARTYIAKGRNVGDCPTGYDKASHH